MAIDWTAVNKKAKQQDAAYNAKATQGAQNRAAYQAIAKNKAAAQQKSNAVAEQMKANPSMLTAKITPITMAQTAAGVAKGSIPNAFQNQKEGGFERAQDIISSGASTLFGGAANAVQMATTGKYSPVGIISRGIDKINGTNYTAQNAANQKSFANKMLDNSLLYSQNAKRGLGKIGQAGVEIGSAATQIGLMALTGGVAGSLGAGSEATGALTKGLMAIQQAGQGAYDAEKSGAGEGTQALYGLLQGATAYVTEGLSNVGALGKVFGNGAADSKLEQASANAISKFIKSETGRAVANRLATGAEAGLGEAFEQNIQDALTPVYQRLTYDKNAKLNAEDMIYNGLVAGAVGGIVGSAGKNNIKALETENDTRAAESRAVAAEAEKAPPVANTTPNLSQVAPNLIKPTQSTAQESAQAPTINESAKEVKLPTETENALKTQQVTPETKANIFPENSAGAKITNDMPQETSSTGKNSVVETIDPATAKPAELRKAVDGNPNLSEEFIKSTLNESRRNLTNTDRQNDEVWFGYNKDFYDKYMPSLPVEAFLQAQYRGDVSPFPDYKFRGTMWPEWEGILTGKSSGGFWSGNPAGYIQNSEDRVVLVTNATDTGNKKYRANREDNGRYKLDEIVAVYTFNGQTRKWENIYTKNGVDVSELMGSRHEYTSAANQTNFFPADSLGAKITTPKSNIPLEASKNTASVQNAQSNELGAANSGFDPYSHLQNKYGNIQPGENPARVVDVPLKTSDDMNVSRGVRTALEAKVTPDEAVGPIQDAVTAERFSFETIKDKDAAARAEATVSQKGYETALRDWTADARSGKVSKDLMAQGQVLYNNAVNAGDYKTGVDILTDYVKMSRNGAQATQANRMLKKLDPQYQLYALERQTQKINEDISSKFARQSNAGAENVPAVKKAAESSVNEAAKAIERATENFGNSAKTARQNKIGTESIPDVKESAKNSIGKKNAARLPVDKKYSEPFTFEYEDKAGQEIGKAVERMFQPRQKKQSTFMEDIVKEIEAFAREKAPKRENTKKPLTATQRLADYINNKEFYSEAWSNAQDYLRAKYAEDPQKLKELDAFVSSTIGVNGNPQDGSKIMLRSLAESAAETGETPSQLRTQETLGISNMAQRVADRLVKETGATGEDAEIIRSAASQYVNGKLADHSGDLNANKLIADRLINAKVKSAMHDIGKTVSQTTKQSGAQKQRISEAVQNMIIQKYGFEGADVSNVGDVVGKHFDAMLKAQADKQLEQMFGNKISSAQKKDIVTRFSELANMGAFDSSEYAKAATAKVFGSSEVTLDPALVKEFSEAKTQEARDAVMDKLKQNVADQMPSSWSDKWNAWRYLSMLGNPRTHIRNIVGNAGFVPVREVKNIIGAGIEKATGSDRTKSVLTMKDSNLVKYAFNDYAEVADSVMKNGKFNDLAGDLNERRQIFKNRGLEALRKGNNKALDTEDVWFAKGAYARSLASYYKANGITEADLAAGKVPEATIDKARSYSVKEAQKATYRDSNAFSDLISSIGRYNGKNKFAKAGSTAVDAILPFRRTPANILARAWEYSPGEFLNVLGGDIRKVRSGDMDASEMIDHISSGMTGTMLLGLGAYLASQGLLTGGKSDDDDKAALATQQGYQDYALNIGGKSITLDWLAPEALPLFTGAEIFKTMQQKSDGKVTLEKVLTNFGNIAEPMVDMSMLQGVNDLIDSVKYSKGNGLFSIAATTAANYLSQGLPTLAGQLERVGEKERETTYIDKTSGIPTSLQYMLGKAANKIPGIEYQQRPYTDMFGQHESSGSTAERVANNLFNPAYVRNIKQDDVTGELSRLVGGKYMSGVPDLPEQKITYGGKDSNLDKNEYTKYAEQVGRLEHKYATSLINNRVYSSMTDEQKADYLKTIFSYAKDEAKRDYINKNGGKYESQMDNVYNAQQAGIDPDDFYAYKKYLKDIDPDGGNSTQLQEAKAISKTDLTTQMKGKLWQMQQDKDTKLDKNPYIGTLAQKGVSPSKTIEIMEAFDTIDDAIGKNYVKADKGPGAAQVKAAYLIQWLSRQGYNANQRAEITDVFTTWQMIPVNKISKKATQFVNTNPMP